MFNRKNNLKQPLLSSELQNKPTSTPIQYVPVLPVNVKHTQVKPTMVLPVQPASSYVPYWSRVNPQLRQNQSTVHNSTPMPTKNYFTPRGSIGNYGTSRGRKGSL